jgi:5-formyltetrahydrofolate cyclo-ligase
MGETDPTPEATHAAERKRALRAAIKSRLATITPEAWSAGSRAVIAHLNRSTLVQARLKPGVTIMAFLALRDGQGRPREIDLEPWLAECLNRGVRVALPCADFATRTMTPRLVTAETLRALAPDARGLRQPPEDAAWVDPNALSLAVIPGLAFDHAGRRLGRGAGFYDRFLAALPPQVLRVGVSLDEQRRAEIPVDTWDMPMHAVATPSGFWLETSLQDHYPSG